MHEQINSIKKIKMMPKTIAWTSEARKGKILEKKGEKLCVMD